MISLALGEKKLNTNPGAGLNFSMDFDQDFGSDFSPEFWPRILARNFDQISAVEIAAWILAWILMTIWSHIIVASTNHVIVYRCGHGLKSL